MPGSPSHAQRAAWFPTRPDPPGVLRRGWFAERPDPQPHDDTDGPYWWRVLTLAAAAADTGIGTDLLADLLARFGISDTGIGIDTAKVITDALQAADTGIGIDHATLTALLTGSDTGIGYDTGTLSIPAMDTGIGTDLAWLLAHLHAADTGIGTDTAAQLLHDQLLTDTGIGIDTARLLPPDQQVTDYGIGVDEALRWAHVDAVSRGVGTDHIDAMVSKFATTDRGVGTEASIQGSVLLPPWVTMGVGYDTATGGFTPQPPTAVIQVTTTGAHQFIPIPVWCRYIDVILLGAGGGGSAGTRGFPGWSGLGGAAGQYASHRWDRGETRNDWTQLAILVGIGGSGGPAPGGDGGNGTATELWIDNDAGWAGIYLAGAGGAGASGEALIETNRPGKSPGNHSFQGINATGGTGNSDPPGSGGRGGGGSVFPLNPGSGDPGARGQAWVRFSM